MLEWKSGYEPVGIIKIICKWRLTNINIQSINMQYEGGGMKLGCILLVIYLLVNFMHCRLKMMLERSGSRQVVNQTSVKNVMCVTFVVVIDIDVYK